MFTVHGPLLPLLALFALSACPSDSKRAAFEPLDGGGGAIAQAEPGAGGGGSGGAPLVGVEPRCEDEVAADDEDILDINGQRLKFIKADIFLCTDGKWVATGESLKREMVRHLQYTRVADGCAVTDLNTGETQKFGSVNFSHTFDFERSSFLDLFGADKWTLTTLLSPLADSVPKYMELNRQLMAGGDFRDNRIDLDTTTVHSGLKSGRFYSVAPTGQMTTTKALLEKRWFCFAKGDDVWFSAWYYLDGGMPSTLVDIEDRQMLQGPGIRVFIRGGHATVELKFGNKPTYLQNTVKVPSKKWFKLKLHYKLSNHDDGVIEMWQDGQQIIDTKGQTLPTHDSIYWAMQVGITATSTETVLFVDDVKLSDKSL